MRHRPTEPCLNPEATCLFKGHKNHLDRPCNSLYNMDTREEVGGKAVKRTPAVVHRRKSPGGGGQRREPGRETGRPTSAPGQGSANPTRGRGPREHRVLRWAGSRVKTYHYSIDADKSRGRGGPPPTPGGRETQNTGASLQSSSALGGRVKRVEHPGGLPSKLIYSRNMCGV